MNTLSLTVKLNGVLSFSIRSVFRLTLVWCAFLPKRQQSLSFSVLFPSISALPLLYPSMCYQWAFNLFTLREYLNTNLLWHQHIEIKENGLPLLHHPQMCYSKIFSPLNTCKILHNVTVQHIQYVLCGNIVLLIFRTVFLCHPKEKLHSFPNTSKGRCVVELH